MFVDIMFYLIGQFYHVQQLFLDIFNDLGGITHRTVTNVERYDKEKNRKEYKNITADTQRHLEARIQLDIANLLNTTLRYRCSKVPT